MMNTDPRSRIVELANDRGVSLSALSALIGRNSTYLQQFVRKGSPRKLEEGDRRTLARFFGVAEIELGGAEEISSDSDEVSRDDWIDIPRLRAGASAGPGAWGEGADAEVGALRFSRRWLRGRGLEPGALSAIAVAGDSMEPTLRDGDEILVDTGPRGSGGGVRDGVHVVRVGDALLVKRLDLGQPGRVVLISDNRAYRPVDLSRADVAVVGRVVWRSGRI
jgi:phage repressor protein C with HTH and peptisase S24 domain